MRSPEVNQHKTRRYALLEKKNKNIYRPEKSRLTCETYHGCRRKVAQRRVKRKKENNKTFLLQHELVPWYLAAVR